MSRWKVGKHRYTGYWLAFSEEYDRFRPATLLDEYQGAARIFDTWRDAMDYADEHARTVEVVLPRIDEHEAYIDGYVGAVESDDGYVVYCRDEDIIIPPPVSKAPRIGVLFSTHQGEEMNDSFMEQQWGTQTIHHGFVWFDTYEEAADARHRLAEYRKRNRIKLAPEEIEARWVTTAKKEFGVRFRYAGSSEDKKNEGWEWFRNQTLRDEMADMLEERGCQVDLYTRFATEPEKQEW